MVLGKKMKTFTITTTSDNGRISIRKAHLSLQLRGVTNWQRLKVNTSFRSLMALLLPALKWQIISIRVNKWILPRLLQRSKECRGHYSTLYHATSQWIMRSDTHLFFWHIVKNSVHLKFKIMSITCRFHVSDIVLTLLISY